MTIDERMRAAQRDQLQRVETEVRRRGLDQPPTRERRAPWLLVAAAAAVAAIVAITVSQMNPSLPTVTVTSAASPSPGDRVPTSTTSTTVQVSTVSLAPTTTVVPTVGVDPGVPNQVCDTGLRAPLETAALRYVSEETGWNRLVDLVNEQDGPYYFGLWEPGYEGTVSVEVALRQPVLATEILLAQHPYKDVSGVIMIETAGQRIPIELSGRDGFRSHSFETPTQIDRFVITRSEVESDITEVIVCVTAS